MKLEIFLSGFYGKSGACASIGNDEMSIDICEYMSKSGSKVCLEASRRLRILADRFDKLATVKKDKIFNFDIQKEINKDR